MKIIITTIFILSAALCNGQTLSYRMAEMEKWKTQAKVQLKNDSIAIAWLKKEKTIDSLKVKVLQDSLAKFKAIWFNPADFITRNGTKIDSVSKRN